MSAFMLIDLAVLLFVAAAVLALLFSFHRGLSGLLAGVGGAVACGLVIAVAAGLLTGRTASGVSAVLYLPQLIRLTPLNAVWLLAIALPGFFISLYNVAWHRHAQVKVNGLLVNLLMAAAVCTLVASDLLTLVVMAEISGLAARFVDEGPGTAVWLLWLVGFGMLAGMIPLHGWVPQAHAGADAPAAALFSGVVMKVGLFGLFVLPLLAGQAMPLWWGLGLLLLGAVTAFVGGLYALMEHNIQRLLAYHTLENIGIILLGLGAGLTGVALGQPALIALGLVGGLYHLINHSLFKTLLLLGAGSVWFTTGHRDIEKLGGIGKRMPVISLMMLVGLMAMAGLPPLNGFAGEWVIYQGFFSLSGSDAFIGRLLGPLLAICCLIGGVASPWLLPLLSAAVPLPLTTTSVVSQPMIALLLIACPLLPLIIMMLFKGHRLPSRSRGAAWACGYEHEQSMVITAHGFAMPVKEAFAPVLGLRKRLDPVALMPAWQRAAPALVRRLALVELAVLVVIVISRGA